MADATKKKKLVKGRHASQIKRQRQNLKIRARNSSIKSQVKTAIKKIRDAVAEKNNESAQKLLLEGSRIIQKASSKGVLHLQNASRKISRLATLVHKTFTSK